LKSAYYIFDLARRDLDYFIYFGAGRKTDAEQYLFWNVFQKTSR